jgi:hypothetical protein
MPESDRSQIVASRGLLMDQFAKLHRMASWQELACQSVPFDTSWHVLTEGVFANWRIGWKSIS